MSPESAMCGEWHCLWFGVTHRTCIRTWSIAANGKSYLCINVGYIWKRRGWNSPRSHCHKPPLFSPRCPSRPHSTLPDHSSGESSKPVLISLSSKPSLPTTHKRRGHRRIVTEEYFDLAKIIWSVALVCRPPAVQLHTAGLREGGRDCVYGTTLQNLQRSQRRVPRLVSGLIMSATLSYFCLWTFYSLNSSMFAYS